VSLDYSKTPSVSLAYVFAELNGVELVGKNSRPQRLTGFQYFRNGEVGGSTVKLSLFDQYWPEIETILLQEISPILRFKYGYTNGEVSPEYESLALSYSPRFKAQGMDIQIDAASLPLDPAVNVAKSRLWPEAANREEMSISDIVNFICDERGWKRDVEETAPVDAFDWWGLAKKSQKQFSQSQQKDTEFIINELLPLAKSKKTGQGGYKFFFEDVAGATVCHFHPPRYDQKGPYQTFTYMWGDPNSEVISFAPEIAPSLNQALGGGAIGVPFIDVSTGQFKTVLVSNQSTTTKTLLGGPLTVGSPPSPDGKTRYNVVDAAPVPNEGVALAWAANRYFSMSQAVQRAELVLVGQPQSVVHRIIRVNVVMPGGKLHYSSGLWHVMSITDEIAGSFTSRYELNRNAYPDAPGVVGELGEGTVNE